MKNNDISKQKSKIINEKYKVLHWWQLTVVFGLHIIESLVLIHMISMIQWEEEHIFLWFSFAKADETLCLPLLYTGIVFWEELLEFSKNQSIKSNIIHLLISVLVANMVMMTSKVIISKMLIYWCFSGIFRIIIMTYHIKPYLKKKAVQVLESSNIEEIIS